MNFTFIIKLMCLVFILQVFAGCGSMVTRKANSHITVEKGAIPPEFGKNVEVLLCVLHDRNSFDRYLKEHVRNEYRGDYEFILENDLKDEKFSDLDKYRYAFRVDRDTRMVMVYNAQTNRHENRTSTTYTYYVVDRKKEENFNSPMTSGYFSRMIEVYIKKLEEERRLYN